MRRVVLLSSLAVVAVLVSSALLAQQASPEELLKLGDTYFKEKTFKKAIESYDKFLEAAPGHAEAHRVRLNVARSFLGLNQWPAAVERLKKALEGTKEGTVERAETLALLGGTVGVRRGGNAQVTKWLSEADSTFEANGDSASRIAVLFDLARSLCYSYDYEVEYEQWEAARKERPGETEAEWPAFQRRRMREIDTVRYDRALSCYRTIVTLAPDSHEGARARFLLGCLHVNVYASVFGDDAVYYPEPLPADEAAKKRQEILDRYVSEVRKGIAAWEEVLAKHGKDGLADDAQYHIALALHERLSDFRAAETEYEALLATFPESEWADTCRSSLQALRREEIRLSVPRPFRPEPGNEVGLAARNVKTLTMKAYRLDMGQMLRGAYVFHDLSKVDVAGLSAFSEWTVPTGVADDRKGVQMPVKLPFAAPGVFLLVAQGQTASCRALVVQTTLGVAVKSTEDGVTLFAADESTGEPREGVRFTVKATWHLPNGKTESRVFEGVSAADGLADVALAGVPRSVNLGIAAQKEDQAALVGEWFSTDREEEAFRVYAFTDRPVYRPSQTVHLKAIVRARTETGFRAVDAKPVKVEIQDPQGRKLLEKTLATNAQGSVSADLALAEEPTLGVYYVRLFIDGNQYYTQGWTGSYFRVEEYKKPEFEVTVTAGAGRVRPGDTVTAKISAKYYFGSPVAAGEAKWQVFRKPYRHFMPVERRYRWYYEDLYPEPREWWGEELVTEGNAPLDENGQVEIAFPAKDYKDDLDSKFEIRATVTDASRREINGSAGVFATRQSFFVHAEPLRWLYKPGDAVEVTIRAEDANRKPVASEGKLVLARRVDAEVEKEGQKVPVVNWEEIGSVPAKTGEDGRGRASIVLDEAGQFRLSYVTAGADKEEIRADVHVWALDRSFRGSQYRFSGVVVATDRDTYQPGDEMQVLVTSHIEDAYLLLSVEADREILFRKVVKAAGRTHLEKIAVGEKWVPNVYVKALAIRDGAVFMNRREVIVPPESRFLDVRLTPAKQGTYLPGEEAAFTVSATGADGEPAEAEVSVAFIDKSILYIAPDTTPDIRQFFYGDKRGDRVGLSSSFDFSFSAAEQVNPGIAVPEYRRLGQPDVMNPWFYSFHGFRSDLQEAWGEVQGELREYSRKAGGRGGVGGGGGAPPAPAGAAPTERMRRELKSNAKGDGGDDKSLGFDDAEMEGGAAREPGAAGAEAPATVRKFFPDTAYWNAHVMTGKDGKAEVKFAFPDSLTTFRATVRGATVLTSVGSAEADFTVRKNILVRLQAPRFFRERDEVVVSGIVHNDFDEEVAVTVRVAVEGECLALLPRGEFTEPEMSFKVGAKKEQRVDWWFKVVRPGEASILVRAGSERESDAMQMKFPVLLYGAEKFLALSGSFTGPGGAPAEGGRAEMRFEIPADRHEGGTTLTVSASPTIAGALLESLPYLADYPYGCVEQTLSRFVPAVVVKKTLLDLGFTLADLGVKPEREVPAGFWGRPEVQKLKVLTDDDLGKAVAAGLKRIAEFQKGDGAWGWFRDSAADVYMTAYVVRGLALARAAGAPVDEGMLQRGAQWLFSTLSRTDFAERIEKGMPVDGNMLASALTALVEVASLSGDPKKAADRIADHLFRVRETLGPTARALLSIACHRLGRGEEASLLLENLTDQMLLDAENGTVRFGRVEGYYFWLDDAVTATATALRAHLLVAPKSEKIAMMVKWLAGNRRGAHWKSTMDTAQAVLALCDYLRVSKELTPDLTVRYSVDGKVLKTVRFTKDNVFTADNLLALRGDEVPAGTRVVTVEAEGRGNLYYSANALFFTTEEKIKGAGNEVLVARQAYRIVKGTKVENRRVFIKDHYEERPATVVTEERVPLPDGAVVNVGDELEMELTLTARNDYHYLVFEDWKGAGFEPVELLSGLDYSGTLSYREFRDERVAFFCARLPQGEHRMSYRVRAEIPGLFHVMPATGHAMYLPEVRGISDSMTLSITEPGVR